MKNIKKFLVIFLVLPFLVFAAQFELKYPRLPGFPQIDFTQGDALPLFVKYIFQFVISILGIIGFFSLVMGAIKYLTSQGDPQRLKEAKEQIVSSFLGMLLLLSSYIVYRQLRPEFVQLSPTPLPQQPTPSPSPLLPPEEQVFSTYLQLPIESALKLDLLKEKRLKEMRKLSKEILERVSTPVGNTILDLSYQLERLTHSCACPNTQCLCGPCTCDPCSPVRSQMTDKIVRTSQKIKEILERMQILQLKKEEFDNSLRKIKEVLRVMRDECPMGNVLSRDAFFAIKKYYQDHKFELKETRVFEGFSDLLLNSFADFYCPISGTRKGDISPIASFEEGIIERGLPSGEEIGGPEPTYYGDPRFSWQQKRELEILKKIQQKYKLPEEFETTFTCPNSVPFGEIMDKLIKFSHLFEQKIDEFLKLNTEYIDKVNLFHESVSKCQSINCRCSCPFSPICTEIRPVCPWDEIASRLREVEKKAEEIEDKTKQIIAFIEIFENFTFLRENPAKSEYIKKRLEELTKRGVSGKEAELIIFREVGQRVIQAIEELRPRFSEPWVAELRAIVNNTTYDLEGKPYQVKEIAQLLFLMIEFEKMAQRIHFTIAGTQGLEMGWYLLNCEKCACGEECAGSPVIDPEGQKMKKKDTDCICQKTTECKEYYPLIKRYECTEITCEKLNLKCIPEERVSGRDRCYDYNLFSCHFKR
jgi:hypothetical protein